VRGRVNSEPETGDSMPREKGSSYPFLTSIRGKDYFLYARGSVDADLIRKERREERKSKFLAPNLQRLDEDYVRRGTGGPK
jgi:hypothetical protein